MVRAGVSHYDFFYSTGFLDWFDSARNGSHSSVLQTAARSGLRPADDDRADMQMGGVWG